MMSLIILGGIGFVVLLVVTILCFKLDDDDLGIFMWIGVIFLIFLIVWIISFGFAIPMYRSAEVKVKILNSQYGTEYTVDEIFWADDLIDKLIRTENDVKDNNTKIELDIK